MNCGDTDCASTTTAPTMTAIRMVAYGTDPAEVFQESSDVPVPPLEKGSVRIAVSAVSMISGDVKLALGMARLMFDKLPCVTGRDAAGVVDAIGPDTKTDLKVGDRVFGINEGFAKQQGACGDLSVFPAAMLTKVPDDVPMYVASAFVTPAQVAWHTLVGKKVVAVPGTRGFDSPAAATAHNATLKMLVLGGSSSCGSMFLQLLKHFGAGTIVTTSSQAALCESLGATRVINHREAGQDWRKLLKGAAFDVVINCVEGVSAWRGAPAVLKRSGGRYITINLDDTHTPMTVGSALKLVGALAWRKPWSVAGYPSFELVMVEKDAAGQAEVLELYRRGAVRLILHEGDGFKGSDDDGRPSYVPWSLDSFRRMFAVQATDRAHGKMIMSRDGL